jgi:hypothetical protein
MAPEVVLGVADTDHRVDLYALGCVAYWLLTGKLIFEGRSVVEVMLQLRPLERTLRMGISHRSLGKRGFAPLRRGDHMINESGQGAETSTAAPERVELTGLFSMLLGVWYPKNYILAAIDAREGPVAMKELTAAGFGSNSLRLEDGARVGQIRAAITEQRTPLQRAAATVSRTLTDEGLMSQQYFEAADAGASLIAVLAPEPGLVSAARQILASHGARYMRFYGDKTITDL